MAAARMDARTREVLSELRAVADASPLPGMARVRTDPSALWVGLDTRRELRSGAVQERLRTGW